MKLAVNSEPRSAGHLKQVKANQPAAIDTDKVDSSDEYHNIYLRDQPNQKQLLNWQDFIKQMDAQLGSQSTAKSQRTTGMRDLERNSLQERHAPSQDLARQSSYRAVSSQSSAPSHAGFLQRSTTPTHRPSSTDFKSRSTWLGKQRNTNIKNLAVTIPKQEIQVQGPERSYSMPTSGRRDQVVPKSGQKSIHFQQSKGYGTFAHDGSTNTMSQARVQISQSQSTKSSNVPHVVSKNPSNEILSHARMAIQNERTVVDGRNHQSRSTRPKQTQMSPSQIPVVLNLHLPRAPSNDPKVVELEKLKLESFKQMLTSFVTTQKEHERQIISNLLNKPSHADAPIQKSMSVLGNKFHKSKAKQVQGEAHVVPATSKELMDSEPLNLDTSTAAPQADTPGTNQVIYEYKPASSMPSPIESFRFMKETIAKISQHESYARSYNAARNFSSNARLSQASIKAGDYSSPEIKNKSTRSASSPPRRMQMEAGHHHNSSQTRAASPQLVRDGGSQIDGITNSNTTSSPRYGYF